VKGPLPIKTRADALNWMRALDLYELATLPPAQCLEVAFQLVQALRRFRLPIRRDFTLWLQNFTAAHEIARAKFSDLPVMIVPKPEEGNDESS